MTDIERSTRMIYVLDTSVLLADPDAMLRFAEHEVVLPLVVISELEGKRHHPELGYFARCALRRLEDLRIKHNGLSRPVAVNDQGGTLRVELNNIDTGIIPSSIRNNSNDSRILAVALTLSKDTKSGRVCLVTKDLPLRLKASAVDLPVDEYKHEQVMSAWPGIVRVTIPLPLQELWDGMAVPLGDLGDEVAGMDLPVNTGLIINGCMARLHSDGMVRKTRANRRVGNLTPKSEEQHIALDLLMDPGVGIVSLGGPAGTGKSALALCAGLELVKQRAVDKIMVFRPLYAVGGQELGYLPGSESDKMAPWAQAVFDTLGSFYLHDELSRLKSKIEVLPLTHIRGRSLHGAFVIIDEAQSLERGVLLTALSRLGTGSRVVLTHDVAQRDNLRVGRFDGIHAVIEKLKGESLFGHVTLTKTQRSPIAELVARLLDS